MADVDSLISAAQGYVSNLLGQASTAMTNAISAATSVSYASPVYHDPGTPDDPPDSIDKDLPDLDEIEFLEPPGPGPAPDFVPIDSINYHGEPSFTEPKPVLELPTKPSTVAEFRGVLPPIKTDFIFPEPPDELLNPLLLTPVLTEHEVPIKPMVTLPAFDGIRPTLTAVAPTDLEQTFANSYSSVAPSFVTAMDGYVDAMLAKHNPQYHAQMAAIEAQLTKYLNGGTGLNTAVEDAIYERSRSKQDAEARRVRDAAWGDAAARGFTLPTGALMSSMQTARQAAADANAASAREIVVMQAEMEQKNLQFAVSTSISLRTVMLNATISYHQGLVSLNGQALEYAKATLNAVIETYNTAVKAFSAQLDSYKADAQVYEVKMRGAMAAIELYKAEIDALQAMINIDKARIDIYRARIDALTGLANVYKAQIEAVLGRVGLEKLKIDLFQSQVQSYVALVQAKNAEWQGYTAAVNGQDSKVKIYSALIDGYRGQIDGYRAKIDAQAEVVKAKALTNQAKAEQYRSELNGYQAIVQARADIAKTKVQIQSQVLDAFRAKISAAVSDAQVQQDFYKLTSATALANAKSDLDAQIAEGQNRTQYGHTLASTATANATIYGQLASSAMAGMNTLASKVETD